MKRIDHIFFVIFLILLPITVLSTAERGPMKPIAPLMIEHRLIDQMIIVLENASVRILETQTLDPRFIEDIVDFVRYYVDKTHHGKEEKILFAELEKKNLSAEHRAMLNELLEEHKRGISTVERLNTAALRYSAGERAALTDVAAIMQELATLYREHIIKEDKHFFIPVMEYFSKEEQDAMLEKSREYDQKMIHVKYKDVISRLKEQAGI
ncbi:MAG: hemerythrin domain-containing protein [Desulfomonilia bacterium]